MTFIETYTRELSHIITTRLHELIHSHAKKHSILYEAANYSLHSKGKRLRPILTLAAAEMFTVEKSLALDPACCIELIHTYSLIHDDLPSMDDDDFRRGKPSLHKAYPESIAILTGDFLLTFAFEVLANSKNISSDKKIELIRILSQKAGAEGMIAGQAIDLLNEGKSIEFDDLKDMHFKKTAALLSACLEFAAVLGNAKPREFDVLKSYALDLGLAFQIQDDILDVTASFESLGKPTKSDIINQKATSISCLGLEKAKEYVNFLHENCIQALSKLDRPTKILKELTTKLILRNS
ncbi:MAG: polyprenyl synthetase family protein [Chlamydiae bacterium CG10_big_fil_rev_8_21_14_0_10_35_9]|nr:MAG: polyprenyl synthetase family protein [Chlamydiae bacterium CG10_big_fil_rev_8_21_14_0_10_35_9]